MPWRRHAGIDHRPDEFPGADRSALCSAATAFATAEGEQVEIATVRVRLDGVATAEAASYTRMLG